MFCPVSPQKTRSRRDKDHPGSNSRPCARSSCKWIIDQIRAIIPQDHRRFFQFRGRTNIRTGSRFPGRPHIRFGSRLPGYLHIRDGSRLPVHLPAIRQEISTACFFCRNFADSGLISRPVGAPSGDEVILQRNPVISPCGYGSPCGYDSPRGSNSQAHCGKENPAFSRGAPFFRHSITSPAAVSGDGGRIYSRKNAQTFPGNLSCPVGSCQFVLIHPRTAEERQRKEIRW